MYLSTLFRRELHNLPTIPPFFDRHLSYPRTPLLAPPLIGTSLTNGKRLTTRKDLREGA
ncbi:hypothetical protein OLMES_3019 [Oleiphilus messinensis]|uniref:Uncharacterized protein n=1 Tax=Oleiphilus messinensis TaxID=141451 RepID=A0A1Y0I969_9GAMM|nr:hypothetical protein OLMES_3019 [Oleiphilus messinensis]